jgi:hypothetical protein
VPVIAEGLEPGSTTVSGDGDPRCVPGEVAIYDCGPEVPPVCYDGNDTIIGTGTKDAQGHFVITVSPPLEAGQRIYAVDGCTDPGLEGPPVAVRRPAPVPVASRDMLVLLAVILSAIGLAALFRQLRSR